MRLVPFFLETFRLSLRQGMFWMLAAFVLVQAWLDGFRPPEFWLAFAALMVLLYVCVHGIVRLTRIFERL